MMPGPGILTRGIVASVANGLFVIVGVMHRFMVGTIIWFLFFLFLL